MNSCLLCSARDATVTYNEMEFCEQCFEMNTANYKQYERAPKYCDPTHIGGGIYIGPQNSAVDKEQLDQRGITKIVVCGKGIAKYHPDDFHYHCLDIDDSLEQQLGDCFDDVYDFMHAHEGSTLIHCVSGISRSATILTAYIMRKQQLSSEDAFKLLKAIHPRAHPNSNFMRQLLDYNARLQAKLPAAGSSAPKHKKHPFQVFVNGHAHPFSRCLLGGQHAPETNMLPAVKVSFRKSVESDNQLAAHMLIKYPHDSSSIALSPSEEEEILNGPQSPAAGSQTFHTFELPLVHSPFCPGKHMHLLPKDKAAEFHALSAEKGRRIRLAAVTMLEASSQRADSEDKPVRRVLLARRGDDAPIYPSIFVFPGGHVDPHEVDILGTAKRELSEEVGIDISEENGLKPILLFEASYPITVADGLPISQHLMICTHAQLTGMHEEAELYALLKLQPAEISGAIWLDEVQARAWIAKSTASMMARTSSIDPFAAAVLQEVTAVPSTPILASGIRKVDGIYVPYEFDLNVEKLAYGHMVMLKHWLGELY